MKSYITVLGLYSFDPTILDGLWVPPDVDPDTFKDFIVESCMELEVVYPEPETFKRAVTVWSAARQHSWERIYKALKAEYNPIENYDRREEWSDDGNGENTAARTGYNSYEMQNTDRTNAASHNRHEGRVHGNIGVTTNAQMITGEMDLRKADMLSIIANEFRQKFCLLVY